MSVYCVSTFGSHQASRVFERDCNWGKETVTGELSVPDVAMATEKEPSK